MKIFNIYPVKNQALYLENDDAMILAHLLEKGLYDYRNLNQSRFIIMDNGAYEKAKVSNSIESLVKLAKDNKVVVDEFVIPDVIGNYRATRELFYKNYFDMLKYTNECSFMYVAHATTYDELKDAIEMLNVESSYINLTLGIPKHCKIDRTSKEAIALYKKCQVPIHFLGIKESYSELLKVKNIIRSCDSVQLLYLARDCGVQDKDLYMQKRKEPVINLETDYVDDAKVSFMKIAVEKELEKHGILR